MHHYNVVYKLQAFRHYTAKWLDLVYNLEYTVQFLAIFDGYNTLFFTTINHILMWNVLLPNPMLQYTLKHNMEYNTDPYSFTTTIVSQNTLIECPQVLYRAKNFESYI